MNNIKVFYKDKYIELTDKQGEASPEKMNLEFENAETFSYAIKLLDSRDDIKSVAIAYSNKDELFKKFLKAFNNIKAAGGLVLNDEGEILVIFRNGRWDLPKGKLKRFENPKNGAVREIEEECGVKNLSIINEFTPTYHLYDLKGKTVIKKTYWYLMRASGGQNLVPQMEEGITKAEWFKKERLPEFLENTYGSITQVIIEFREKFA